MSPCSRMPQKSCSAWMRLTWSDLRGSPLRTPIEQGPALWTLLASAHLAAHPAPSTISSELFPGPVISLPGLPAWSRAGLNSVRFPLAHSFMQIFINRRQALLLEVCSRVLPGFRMFFCSEDLQQNGANGIFKGNKI